MDKTRLSPILLFQIYEHVPSLRICDGFTFVSATKHCINGSSMKDTDGGVGRVMKTFFN